MHDDSLHNYSDIGEMNFKLHLTTNYENLLDDYLKCDNRPILLKDIQFSTQRLFDEKGYVISMDLHRIRERLFLVGELFKSIYGE